MQIITAPSRRVIRWTETLRNMKEGDAVVFPRKPRGFNGVNSIACKLGLFVTTSAPAGEPAIIVRIS